MTAARRPRSAGPLLAFLALLGAWAGHTLELLSQEAAVRTAFAHAHVPSFAVDRYLASRSLVPFGGAHSYMVGAGLTLVIAAAALTIPLFHVWRGLTRRAAAALTAYRRLWRNHHVAAPDRSLTPCVPSRLVGLWIPLAFAQMFIYTVQENAEAAARGWTLPWLGALAGSNWNAAWIHAGIALVLTLLVIALSRVFRRKVAGLVAIERALRQRFVLIWQRRIAAPAPAWRSPRASSFRDALGSCLWQRPPPIPVPA